MNVLNEKNLIFEAQQNSNYIIINVIFLSFIMCQGQPLWLLAPA